MWALKPKPKPQALNPRDLRFIMWVLKPKPKPQTLNPRDLRFIMWVESTQANSDTANASSEQSLLALVGFPCHVGI